MIFGIKKYLTIAVATMLAAGCSDKELAQPDVREESPVSVRLSLDVAPLDCHVIGTRSGYVDETSMEDDTVQDLWVLQFDGTDGTAPLREARYYASYDPSQMFKLIASSVPNRVVLVANTFDDEIAFSHCVDLAEFMQSFRAVTQESDLTTVVGGKYSSLMSGYLDVTLNEAGVTLDIDLLRTICKVNVTITNTTKETSARDIDIQAVTMRSVPSKSFFFNSYELPERYPAKYDRDRIDYPATSWTDGTGSGETRSFTFYLPVNKSGTAEVPHNPLLRNASAPDGATYLSISGSYDDPDDPSMKRPVEFRVMLGGSKTDYNLLPNSKYDYAVTIDDESDAMSDSRQIEQAVVDFRTWEHANTYMINPTKVEGAWKSYRIPVAKCHDFWNEIDGYYPDAENALMPGGNGWKVEVIWSEMPITYDTNFKWIKDEGSDWHDWFEFALPCGFEHGNIVIGIRRYTDAGRTQLTDGFIWSWQMWVTDYDPYPALKYVPQVDSEGNELRFAYSVPGGDVHRYNFASWKTGDYKDCFIMDRNLGNLSVGPFVSKAKGFLFYAWGRKDPFRHGQTIYPGPAGLVYGAIGTNATGYDDNVLYTIAHPNMYIYGLSLWGTNYWQKNSVSANRIYPWGDPRLESNRKGKSVYDPCPPGWRIPDTDVLNKSVTNSTNATGHRYYELAEDIRAVYPTGGALLCDRNGIEQGNQLYMWFSKGCLSSSSSVGDQNGCGRYVRCVTDKPFDK